MAQFLGDIVEDSTVYFIWATNAAGGTSATREINGTIRVYKDNSLVQTESGITDIEDFDSVTGVHSVSIDTSVSSFYSVGSDYQVVIVDTGVDGVENINAPIGYFSIENRIPLKPVVTYRTQTVSWYIEDPVASDNDLLTREIPDASSITEVIFGTDTGTVDFNIEIRNKLTPLTAGTDILAADDQAGTTGESVTSFSVTAISAGSWIVLDISAVASSPTEFVCTLIYSFD